MSKIRTAIIITALLGLLIPATVRAAAADSSVTYTLTLQNTGEKGKGGMAADGPGALAARDLGRGWKIGVQNPRPSNSTGPE